MMVVDLSTSHAICAPFASAHGGGPKRTHAPPMVVKPLTITTLPVLHCTAPHRTAPHHHTALQAAIDRAEQMRAISAATDRIESAVKLGAEALAHVFLLCFLCLRVRVIGLYSNREGWVEPPFHRGRCHKQMGRNTCAPLAGLWACF
jgi:hypothetical protein